ncbi:hypothetical protein [Archangium sp.]|uniref:hypothetical protein n=1 Tax=Archangium sp. TaxID=1872627 RepID=UPI002D297D08|nr:hypothetical protein [Archangium sp.]HYO59398.1 hypothetical protein [Archangium sp.]
MNKKLIGAVLGTLVISAPALAEDAAKAARPATKKADDKKAGDKKADDKKASTETSKGGGEHAGKTDAHAAKGADHGCPGAENGCPGATTKDSK